MRSSILFGNNIGIPGQQPVPGQTSMVAVMPGGGGGAAPSAGPSSEPTTLSHLKMQEQAARTIEQQKSATGVTIDTTTETLSPDASTPSGDDEGFFEKHGTKIAIGVGVVGVAATLWAIFRKKKS